MVLVRKFQYGTRWIDRFAEGQGVRSLREWYNTRRINGYDKPEMQSSYLHEMCESFVKLLKLVFSATRRERKSGI